jgi:hypothetical protein
MEEGMSFYQIVFWFLLGTWGAFFITGSFDYAVVSTVAALTLLGGYYFLGEKQ